MSGKGMFPKRRIRPGSVADDAKRLRDIQLPGDLLDDYPGSTFVADYMVGTLTPSETRRFFADNFLLANPLGTVMTFARLLELIDYKLGSRYPHFVLGLKEFGGLIHLRFLERPTSEDVHVVLKTIGDELPVGVAIEWSVLRRCWKHSDCAEDRELGESCFHDETLRLDAMGRRTL